MFENPKPKYIFFTVLLGMAFAMLGGHGGFATAEPANSKNTQTEQAAPPATQPTEIAQEEAIVSSIENSPQVDFFKAGTSPIRVKNNRLSIKVEQKPFGEVIQMVGQEAGFEVVISPDIAGKTLSTEFHDVELQRGIQRLLTLISHRNYFIFYDENDDIKKIEIYGNSSISTTTTKSRSTGVSSRPNSIRSLIPKRDAQPIRRATPAPRRTDRTITAPYIPPSQEPAYIPPRKRIR